VDSQAHTPPVASEIVKANLVAADSEILNEIASKVDAWIRQHAQPLLTQKSSKKPLPQVTCGLVSAHSPNWLRNSQQKLSRYQFINHQQNRFHR
jgi:hypothetical protein